MLSCIWEEILDVICFFFFFPFYFFGIFEWGHCLNMELKGHHHVGKLGIIYLEDKEVIVGLRLLAKNIFYFGEINKILLYLFLLELYIDSNKSLSLHRHTFVIIIHPRIPEPQRSKFKIPAKESQAKKQPRG